LDFNPKDLKGIGHSTCH